MGAVALLRERSIRVGCLGVVIAGAGMAVLLAGTAVPAESAGRTATSTSTTIAAVDWAGGSGPLQGSAFPALSGIGLDGRPVSTRPRDKPVVVLMWDTTCRCDGVFAAANTAVLRAGDTVDVVGINLDRDLAKAAQTNLDAGLLFPSMTDATATVRRLVGATPEGTLLVLDRNGDVVADFRGPVEGGPDAFVGDVSTMGGS